MLRSCGRVSTRFAAQLALLLTGSLISTLTLWCSPPSVVFNGVATVVNTGSVGLNHPKGLIIASDGDVYIADTAHHQIVEVNPDGSVAVVAITGLSTGLNAPEGVALD